jgi:cellulose synthase/poly-beta-1,6-N-acetylglucosamine synthase-like glycosyltransferase
MIIVNFALFIIASLYGLFVCYLIFVLLRPLRNKMQNKVLKNQLPGISVVIPFRNEVHNLESLLKSLNAQDYKESVEIILVNDQSTDNYNDIISQYSGKIPLKTVDSQYSSENGLSSKQQALELGIRISSHDWIALTDADMVFEPIWLSSLAARASGEVAMVFGHTVKKAGGTSGLFAWFQTFQLETLFSVAYAFSQASLTGSCMGNNLLISKKAFNDADGYRAMGYSITEDCDLLKAFRKKGLTVATTYPFNPTAYTSPCSEMSDFFNQVMRWAKGGFGKNPVLALAGSLLGIQNILFILGIIGILTGPMTLLTFGNLLLTWLFIALAFKKIGSRQHPLHFWPFYLLFLVESMIIFGALIIRHPIVWKERTI